VGTQGTFDPKSLGTDFIVAFQALPAVLVMSVLSSLLFYWRIMPPIVRGFSWVLEKTLDVGGASKACRRRPTFLSARLKRRYSSGPIFRSSRAVNMKGPVIP
jgi:nucleoside permease NupC